MERIKKNSLGMDALILTFAKVTTLLLTFISAMILSRYLSLEEYGTYSQILIVINLMTALLMLGLPNSINFFLSKAESVEQKRKFLSTYYSFSTILSLLVGLVLISAVPLITEYFNNEIIRSFIYFLAVYPWTKIIMSSIENVLVVYKRVSLLTYYRIINSISLLLIIIITQVLNLSFNMYMLLFIIVQTIFTFVVYILSKNVSGKLRISFDLSLIREILKFSIPLGIASVIGTLNIELDKLMIGNFFDTKQLAIYTNASRELPISIIATSLTAVLLPQLVRLLKSNDNYSVINLWSHASILSYIFMSLLAIGFFVFAEDIITLLYSEKFISGVNVFRVYCLVLLLKFTYFGMILNAKGQTRFILYSSIASMLINIVLNYLFYLYFGFIGPALATFISMLVIIVAQLVVTSRTLQFSFFYILPWKKLFSITLLNIGLGIIFGSIKKITDIDEVIGSITESIILGAFWAAIYFLFTYKTMVNSWKNLKGDESYVKST
jgi:O-antigen/teichoic acid export membrane protein